MNRLKPRPSETDPRRQPPPALWRGVGCLAFVALTVGMYLAAGHLIDAVNAAQRAAPFLPAPLRGGIPRQEVVLLDYRVPPSTSVFGVPLPRPVDRLTVRFDAVALAVAVFLAIIAFSLVSLVWAFLNPYRPGPRSAPPPRNDGRTKTR